MPFGETYIVPYEGEKEEPSASEVILPVQVGDSLLYYTIKRNRARSVAGEGEAVRQEADRLVQEPAYGNMAELGFGVLADFGITPIGEILLVKSWVSVSAAAIISAALSAPDSSPRRPEWCIWTGSMCPPVSPGCRFRNWRSSMRMADGNG